MYNFSKKKSHKCILIGGWRYEIFGLAFCEDCVVDKKNMI